MKSGVAAHQEILALCDMSLEDPDDKETTTGLIHPCLKRNVRSAGYDLRLGPEYYLQERAQHGRLQVQNLSRGGAETLVIPPNQVAIVTTIEQLRMPANMVGHLSLKLNVLLEGVILTNQSQIDAAYTGCLFVLLYNLSNRDVSLQFGQSLLRLELVYLSDTTAAPYKGDYKNVGLAGALKSRVESSLHVMRRDLDRIRTSINRTQIAGALILLGVTVVTSFFTYLGPLAARVTRVEEQLANSFRVQALDSQLRNKASLQDVDSLKAEIEQLRRDLAESKRVNSPPPVSPRR